MSAMTIFHEGVAARGDELFKEHQQQIYRDTDKLFARLMILQWLVGIGAAFVITPLTWDGVSSAIHIHVWASIFIGGIITLFPVWLTRVWPGAAITRHVIAVAQMLMSALLISLTGGRIETHFHVFGSLVILSFYRDWRVLIPATIVVAVDHFLRGVYWPYSVYGVLVASPWRSMEHAGWVVFEDVFLVISCLRSVREMRAIASRTAALEASEHNFREIFEEAPIGIAVVGLDERFRQANTTFCQMLGYSEQELRMYTPLDLTYPGDIALSRELRDAMLNNGGKHQVEKRYLRKSGEVVWTTRSGCVIRDTSGKPRHFLIMAEDISERKRAEEALCETNEQLAKAKEMADRANRAKSEFLSRMSHELRTPLNAILGFSQLLGRRSLTELQREGIAHITSAGRHLLDLINEVLDISRIETGRIQLSVEPVRVSEVLAEAVDLIRPLAHERNIELCGADHVDSEWHVLGDRQRFKQVLLNLLSNAVKYTPMNGRVVISADLLGEDKIRVVVSDTGPGIAPKNLSRLFTPFERLGAEHSEVQGTGLGLALSQRLIQAMGGTIGVESELGKGSTFWVELPRTICPSQKVSQHKAGSSREDIEISGPTSKCTVLYIEDNLSNLTLIERIVAEQPGIELVSAMQGKLGLDLARRHAPDLILLDLHLPDMPGWEVLAHLKATAETRDIPTVVLSADATARQIDRLLAAGAHAYLTKPVDVDQLINILDETNRGANRAERTVITRP
jgi:two-component system sensor histidine kinase/response regulator